MNIDSGSEGEKKQPIITFEGPEYIEQKQNIFDQPPFSSIVKITAKQTEKEIDDIRRLLSVIARSAPVEIANFSSQEIKEIAYSASAFEYAPTVASRQDRFWKMQIGEVLLNTLNKYPYWATYLKQPGSDRSLTGLTHEQTKYVPPTESYGRWITEKLKKEEVLKMKGIEDVFGLTLQGKGVGEFMPRNPASRRWVILHAAELTRGGK